MGRIAAATTGSSRSADLRLLLSRIFLKVDKDGSGSLSPSEFETCCADLLRLRLGRDFAVVVHAARVGAPREALPSSPDRACRSAGAEQRAERVNAFGMRASFY